MASFRFLSAFLLPGLLLAAPALSPAGVAQAEPGPCVLERWTVENGLPQNTVNAILQTRDGYLWLGTFDGLARFDGVHFRVFRSGQTPGLPSSRILALHEDRGGALWIRTETSGLARLREGRFEAAGPGVLSGPEAWLLGETADGPLWFPEGRSLTGLSEGGTTRVEDLPGPAQALLRSRSGDLWIGTSQGLVRRRGTALEVFTWGSKGGRRASERAVPPFMPGVE